MERNIEKSIAERLGVSKKQADELWNMMEEILFEQIVADEDFRIRGFGSFKHVVRASRTGRNPQTGEPIVIPAKKAIKFKPSAKLKEAVEKTFEG